jgi:hypothetical protein
MEEMSDDFVVITKLCSLNVLVNGDKRTYWTYYEGKKYEFTYNTGTIKENIDDIITNRLN